MRRGQRSRSAPQRKAAAPAVAAPRRDDTRRRDADSSKDKPDPSKDKSVSSKGSPRSLSESSGPRVGLRADAGDDYQAADEQPSEKSAVAETLRAQIDRMKPMIKETLHNLEAQRNQKPPEETQ